MANGPYSVAILRQVRGALSGQAEQTTTSWTIDAIGHARGRKKLSAYLLPNETISTVHLFIEAMSS